MTDTPSGTLSYNAPVSEDDDGERKRGHVRHFSDSALAVGGGDGDARSVSSSWAPVGAAASSPGASPGRNAAAANSQTRQSTTRLSSSSPPRRSRTQGGGGGRRTGEQPNSTDTTKNNRHSLQDQFVAGTLDLLKMAGGATLSTTGKLVQPPLSVAQNVLIPALWSALVDYLQQVTPLRIKDWFRILTTSAHHMVTVIGSTRKGKLFRYQVAAVGDGIVDCVSSDASRQAIMDGMAAWVKLSEALHTPETKVFLDQLSVLACRLVDVASSGRNKQLLHNVSSAIWAGLELMADPSSTLAFAEVTAYLCFALEMEDALHRNAGGVGGANGNEDDNAQQRQQAYAALRRRQRNVYQKNTYTNATMTQDANSSVEQVMLSSLGEQVMDDTGAGTCEQGSFPTNVVLPSGHDSGGDWLEGETQEMKYGLDWRERAGDDIDLQLLQERITKRAAGLQMQQEDLRRRQPDVVDALLRAQGEEQQEVPKATSGGGSTEKSERQSTGRSKSDIEEIIVTTVDENDDDETEYEEEVALTTGKPQSAATSVKSSKGTADELQYQRDCEEVVAGLENKDDDEVHEWLSETFTTDQPPVATVDGESAYSRFYRRLDEIMDKKRTEAVVNVLNQQLGDDSQGGASATTAALSWFPKAAAAAGAGNERGQDTIKNRVAALKSAARSQIGVGGQQLEELAQDKDTRRAFFSVSFVTGLVGMFWFAMGFYGCYVMVFGPVFAGSNNAGPLRAGAMTSGVGHGEQEIIVRIVREVVHVDANGNTLNTERYRPVTADEDVDKLAACVANAVR